MNYFTPLAYLQAKSHTVECQAYDMTQKGVKPPTTPEIGKAKQLLFRMAFKRIDRAIKNGFHIEAIAITESLICDRLETTISIVTGNDSHADNLGPLLSKIRKLIVFPAELIDQLDIWRKNRNLVVHQMVKITNSDASNWRFRMRFARLIALEGKSLLLEVQVNTNTVKNRHGRKLKYG